ncbi:STAS domain-containing protein [Actinomadura parmotrematis]|uniref:Anti-sigma factor antagonist n=1 Tax=Actinomadura parmotrematis TaxID=2864039 RepID=A0ABS7FQM3_9ACTN|nr:STAS domain-containing protein [Actinomadura parmotrematis]MBW8482703.1 STAS domain-containing protein [Actinomadura parmotrematis]
MGDRMGLKAATRAEGTVTVVTLSGELTLGEAADQAAVDILADLGSAFAEGRLDVVLDLSELTFLDSAGLKVVLRLHHATVQARGRLMLAALRPGVIRVLDIVGLDRHLTLYSTVDEALTDLR